MKITDPEVIKSGEKDLIESVQEDLDLGAVREILKERMAVAALASKGGQIVVHNNDIAFRLDFEVNLSGSLLFDRQGNLLDESDPKPPHEFAGDLDDGMDFSDFEDELSLSDASASDNLEEDQSLEQDLEEELSIDLPDYDLEDELEDRDELEDEDDLEDSLEDDLEENLEKAMGLEADLDLEEDLALLDHETEDIDDDLTMEEDPHMADYDDDDDQIALDKIELEENELEDDPMNSQDLDDDINDIIKESREFWEQKKDS